MKNASEHRTCKVIVTYLQALKLCVGLNLWHC